ncbi:hypothetical protein Tco_0792338 [Tanacetum coccineum]
MDEEFTTTAYPNVQENSLLMRSGVLAEPASSTRTLSSLQNLDKDLSFTDQFFVEKPYEEEPGKTNAEAESESDSPLPTSTATTSTITKTTTLPPPPPQSTTDPILVCCISEIEQHITDLIQNNLALEEWLDKHGSRLYKLENLNIPHQVIKAVDEIVTDVVDWAMQASGICPSTSVELDYSNQRLAYQEEARKKKRKRRKSPRTPPGSPPTQPPPPAGASGAPGTSGASGSSQFTLPPPPPSTGTFGFAQQQGTDIPRAQELSPTDYLMQDDSIPEEQVHLSDDEDSENDHQPKADSRKDWWKPLPEEERPATPEPAWTIPSSNKSDVVNNWASALATTYEPPAENSLLAKIGDMTTFMNWYCQKVNKTMLTQADFKGQAYEVVKAFYQMPITFVLQIEECHKMLTDQIDDVCTYDISAKYGTTHWWFNRQKFYIDRHDSPSHRKDVRTHMRILSVIKIKAYSRYGYDYLSKIVLRRADFQEHTIAERDFKNLYPIDFEDLNLLLLQGHLDHLPGSDKRMISTAVKLWTQNLVIQQRVEDFQLGIESYQTQLNLTKPGWDATGYEFKHDYNIIESPRAVVFPIDNNDRKIMRFNEIYKFSDRMLTRILRWCCTYFIGGIRMVRLDTCSHDPTRADEIYPGIIH